ncbi:MAG TPA: FtsQ-type POTRA domain-containing protein [Pseudonocardiaceae bacterium]
MSSRTSGTGVPRVRGFGRIGRAGGGLRFPNSDHEQLAKPTIAPRGPMRARRWWPWLLAGLAVLAVAAAAIWAVLGSSLLDVRSVQVAGARELPVDEVRAAAAVALGTPMLRLDTKGIEARVAAVPRVATVAVRRALDGTVWIEITERAPVAIVRRGSGVHLVDATGADYAAVPVGPPGLPELRVARVGPRDAATVAALTVLAGLPQPLRAQVLVVAARSPADVVLRLSTGQAGNEREVRWGGVDQGDRKASVLGPLLTRPGKIYDVSSPTLPTVA